MTIGSSKVTQEIRTDIPETTLQEATYCKLGVSCKAFKNDVDRQELAYQKRLCIRQLIASWGVSCKVVSIFGNYIRNLFYIFLVA
jgi:hypothetical protein